MFQRIAIVNRGEAAMRLIHAVRDLNAENPGGPQTTTIALFTDGERSAMFAREADEAYPIGPASERPYLNHQLLARVLQEAKALADAGVRELPEPVAGAHEWQLWSYSPALVPDAATVDPLSLTLSLQDNADDRVQLALGELKGTFPW